MLEPVFNELSAEPPALNVAVAFERMSRLIELLRTAPDHGLDPGLRIPQTFHACALSPDYRIWDWVNDSRVPMEQRLFLLTLATRSPYLDQAPEVVQERALLVDLRVGGIEADGLRTAYLLQTPLFSFFQTPWDCPLIDCMCSELVDDSLGAPHAVQLPNVAVVSHFATHADWIRARRQRTISSGHDLWKRRDWLFPHLEFCPPVQTQLLPLRPSEPRFQQVIDKLFDLETYFTAWGNGRFDRFAFPKCNPVSPETLSRYPEDYRFSNGRGQQVVGNWHLYLTPGKGRLYFDADSASRRGVICHIGDKLPDVTYGRT
jgi:hypothetical protein